MKDVINKVLRDKGVIDNGISDILAKLCGEMTFNVIREEMSFTGMAIEAMSGILANPDCSAMKEGAVAEAAMANAEALHKKLYHRIDLLESPVDSLVQ